MLFGPFLLSLEDAFWIFFQHFQKFKRTLLLYIQEKRPFFFSFLFLFSALTVGHQFSFDSFRTGSFRLFFCRLFWGKNWSFYQMAKHTLQKWYFCTFFIKENPVNNWKENISSSKRNKKSKYDVLFSYSEIIKISDHFRIFQLVIYLSAIKEIKS